jgi:glucose/arabinose dehydrogenase
MFRGARARAAAVLATAAAALAVAACSSGAQASGPTWVPAPSFQGEGDQQSAAPNVPAPAGPSPSASGSASTSPGSTDDPAVVATKLHAPDAIVIMPDGSALVGERTGRIVSVQPKPNQPVRTVRTLTGLDTAGDGGLLDLTLSPNYAQDNLVFAYITTPIDSRLVDFTLTGPVTPVLTGIPKGASGNTGRIVVNADGTLSVGTSDAGQPSLAPSRSSLAGKVLRLSDIGGPATGNPYPGSAVFASGLSGVAGLCLDSAHDVLFAVQPSGVGGKSTVVAVHPGADYGWPTPSASTPKPLATLPTAFATPGGCAVQADALYVTSLDGKALLAAPLTVSGSSVKFGSFTTYLPNRYGRLQTVVAAPDGALWLTTANRAGNGKPIPDDERVLRIQAPAGGSSYPG